LPLNAYATAYANAGYNFAVIENLDSDGDGSVDLTGAVLALQVLSGVNPAGIPLGYPLSGADFNGDGKIGIEEMIYILQRAASLRSLRSWIPSGAEGIMPEALIFAFCHIEPLRVISPHAF
jgi:hypothetical protein